MNRFLLLVLAMTLSGAACAHPGLHFHGDLAAGHPFAGADVFAGVCAAIWAAMLGGRVLRAAYGSAGKKNGR